MPVGKSRIDRFAEFARIATSFRGELFPPNAVNLHGVSRGMLSDGAGVRHGVFVQGCLRYCVGCKNRREARPTLGRLVTPVALAEELSRVRRMRLRTAVYPPVVALDKALRLAAAHQCLADLAGGPALEATLSGVPVTTYLAALRWLQTVALGLSRARALQECSAELTEIDVAGVTLSGGEPALQAPALTATVRALRETWPSATVWLYSSFAWSELEADPETRALVAEVDVLKSGAFAWRQRGGGLYFGSANQRLLDARASLAAGAPVAVTLNEPAASLDREVAELAATADQRILHPDVVSRVAAHLDEPPGANERIEQLEAWLGPVDGSFPRRLFATAPSRRARRFAFLEPGQLNVHSVSVDPLAAWPHPVLEVRLQGTRRHPPTHVRPAFAALRPGTLLTAAELLARATGEGWIFHTTLPPAEALVARARLAMLRAAVLLQARYGLRRSPLPGLSLAEYCQRAERFGRWVEGLFTRGGVGVPLTGAMLTVRGGDPALQPDGVLALLAAARKQGLPTMVELPHAWAAIQRHDGMRRIAAAADLVTSGPPARREPPPLHPLLSSSAQSVRHGATGEPWRPASAELGLRALVAFSADPVRLCELGPSCLAADALRTGEGPTTLEELIAQLGDTVTGWPPR